MLNLRDITRQGDVVRPQYPVLQSVAKRGKKYFYGKDKFCTKAWRCNFPMKFHRKYHNFIGKFMDFIGNFLWRFLWSFLWKLHFQAFVIKRPELPPENSLFKQLGSPFSSENLKPIKQSNSVWCLKHNGKYIVKGLYICTQTLPVLCLHAPLSQGPLWESTREMFCLNKDRN